MRLLLVFLLVLIVGHHDPRAEVLSSTGQGFSVKNTLTIDAKASKVFDSLVNKVGSWWNSSHTFSGDAANLSIEPRAGGCFCERLESGGAVVHLTVVNLQPPNVLRMVGGLGPLQEWGVAGVMTFSLEGTEEGTQLTVTYNASGYLPTGLEKWAAPVDGVIREQVERLKSYVETGSPD